MQIIVQQQGCNQWCWAAIIEALANFYTPGSPVTQCQAVDACVFGPLGNPGFCCNTCDCKLGVPGGRCDVPFDVGGALVRFNFAASPNGYSPSLFSFSQIAGEIQLSQPVVASWHSTDGLNINHAVVVVDTAGIDTVVVANPMNASVQSYSYSLLVAGSPQWRWQRSYPTVNLNG